MITRTLSPASNTGEAKWLFDEIAIERDCTASMLLQHSLFPRDHVGDMTFDIIQCTWLKVGLMDYCTFHPEIDYKTKLGSTWYTLTPDHLPSLYF